MPRSRLAADEGFTLVELLVVLVIIGILAAIGMAAFLSQRTKAQDGEAKVYAATAAKAMMVWGDDHGGYAGAPPAGLATIERSLAGAPGLIVDGDADSFTVRVASNAGDQGGGSYTLERSDTAGVHRTCEHPGQGACAASPDASGNSWRLGSPPPQPL